MSRTHWLNTLAAMDAAFQATRYTEDEGVDTDDFANNAQLPEWKQRCIKGFVECQNKGWTGNCYECLRRCEGQRDWPIGMCSPSKGRRR